MIKPEFSPWIYTQDTTNVAYVAGDVINTGTQECAGQLTNDGKDIIFTIFLSRPVQGNVIGNDVTFTEFTIKFNGNTITPSNYTIGNGSKTAGGLRFRVSCTTALGNNNQNVTVIVNATITVT